MTTALIAFSGGLDTSFLTKFCREAYNITRVITCTVNTGGFSDEEVTRIAARSKELGADQHIYRDGSRAFYETIIKYLIYGNVSRDGYPLCVSSERLTIAIECLAVCKELGADIFIHGSTGAGNDQYRFDVAAQVLNQGATQCRAPIREFGITRTFATDYLKEHSIPVPTKASEYSYNPGLWGVSIGGKETLLSDGLLPEDAWHSKPQSSVQEKDIILTFDRGELTSLVVDEVETRDPVTIIQKLGELGSLFGIGRHYHIGTSIPGKKGRLAYESPAADIIYEAHRTLEKVTLSQAQISGKKPLAETFGAMVHEAKMFDPYLDDIRAFLQSTQRRVTGSCTVRLVPHAIASVRVKSPYDLLTAQGSTYGEVSSSYSGADAAGSALLHGYEQRLYHSVNAQASPAEVADAA
jgi:argininosuccinate synthase